MENEMVNVFRLYTAANYSLCGDVYERVIDRITGTHGSMTIPVIEFIFKSELESMDFEEVFTIRKARRSMDLFVIAGENVHPSMVSRSVMGEFACYDVKLACEITTSNDLEERYFRIFSLQPRNPIMDDFAIVISRATIANIVTIVPSHNLELGRDKHFRNSIFSRHVYCNREFAERYC